VTATAVVEQLSREVSGSATLGLLFENPVIGEFAERLKTVAAPDDAVAGAGVEEGAL
jgi:hypothetical protein